jgi:replication factor C large subunit
MVEWTEKYRPKMLDDVIGNKKAKDELRKWAEEWIDNPPKKRALVLMGDPGIGKTTCAHALANEMGWQVVEMNASDSRNAEAIKKVATHGTLGETFTDEGDFNSSKAGQRKLIILDEADNIFGREDYGGIKAMGTTILNTQQPIILIVNDFYELKRRSTIISQHTKSIKFSRPRRTSIKRLLKFIASNENISVSDEVLGKISEKSSGDVRSAINDLQSISEGRSKIDEEDVLALGYRDTSKTIFNSLAVIYKTGNCIRSREAMMALDENPEMLILWIDENIPIAYKDPKDIAAAYDVLAKADRFLGRVRRKQYYGLWSYAGDMMSCGVSLAKSRSYPGYVNYAFPSWLRKMSSTKVYRSIQTSFGRKLGTHTNKSAKVALQEYLPYFRALYTQDREFRLTMTKKLALTEEEVGFLLREKPDSHKVRHVFDALRKLESVSKGEHLPDEESTPEVKSDEKEVQTETNDDIQTDKDTQSSLFEFE